MSFTLKDNQQVTFSVTGKDAAGNDAPLTGTPVYAVDDPSVLALTDNGDGSGSVAAQGKVGTGTLSVTDGETNGKQFIGSVAIDVIAGDVASVAVSLGAPTDVAPAQPDQPPVVDPNAPPVVDPNAPPVVDPNAPPVVDPNAPPAVDPNAPPTQLS